jgi:hypothetical protein
MDGEHVLRGDTLSIQWKIQKDLNEEQDIEEEENKWTNGGGAWINNLNWHSTHEASRIDLSISRLGGEVQKGTVGGSA